MVSAVATPADISPVDLVNRWRQRRAWMLAAGCILLVALVALGTGSGAVSIGPGKVLAILANEVGLTLPWSFDARDRAIVLAIRLPRVCLGVLAGAALAISGAALQGLFRNPLADPVLVGVSNGAAVSEVAVIVLGPVLIVPWLPAFAAPYLLPMAAFAGGLLSTLIVYRIANRGGQTDVATMLLAGVAMNALAGAGIGLFIFASDGQQNRDINFWMLGSLGGITWATLIPVIPLIVLPVLALQFFARHLNVLLLGEGEAVHLGFEVERVKRRIIVLVALATGASVAVTGVIGFVGLVVPHLVRMAAGPNHRMLLPGVALIGASLMIGADLLARTVALPAELPIGILTSLVGGPFFLWLLVRRRALAGW